MPRGRIRHAEFSRTSSWWPWLGKAKQARRYEPRQFPFMNLGRVYLKQGRWWDALREFEGDVHAAKALHQLRGQLN